jgi:hypothetical protein
MARLASRRPGLRLLVAGLVAVAGSSSCADSSGAGSGSSRAPAGSIVIDVTAAGRPFDRRLLGTNVPAWIGQDKPHDPDFQQRVRDLGTTSLRMPGGSWSNYYDWLGCENGDPASCYWTWAARPSDFLELLESTGLAGMWTVNVNGTAEEAAALVAFFNGSVDDQRPIGVDPSGQDWSTVGTWAALRAAHGHPDPHPIHEWEVGNEVYGGKSGKGCTSFGWEDVWTCDGTEYVDGRDGHQGYRDFRTAMRAVDPTILSARSESRVPSPAGATSARR